MTSRRWCRNWGRTPSVPDLMMPQPRPCDSSPQRKAVRFCAGPESHREAWIVVGIQGVLIWKSHLIASVTRPTRLDLSFPRLEQIEKGGFKHFMLKEIMVLLAFCLITRMAQQRRHRQDQPNAMRNCLRGRIYQPPEAPNRWEIKLGGLEKASPCDNKAPLASFI